MKLAIEFRIAIILALLIGGAVGIFYLPFIILFVVWQPILLLFGIAILVGGFCVWRAVLFVLRGWSHMPLERGADLVALVFAGVLFFLCYLPVGPDPCSRNILASNYVQCVDHQLKGMSMSDAMVWLAEQNYAVDAFTSEERLHCLPNCRTLDADRNWVNYNSEFKAEKEFETRDHVPYGTNFYRVFSKFRFENSLSRTSVHISVYGSGHPGKVVHVRLRRHFNF